MQVQGAGVVAGLLVVTMVEDGDGVEGGGVEGGDCVVGGDDDVVDDGEDGVDPGEQVQRPQVVWQKPSGTPGAAPEIAWHCPRLCCRAIHIRVSGLLSRCYCACYGLA